MARPPFEPLPPPWATLAQLQVSAFLSWLLAISSSWSTHAYNLKERPWSPPLTKPSRPPAKFAQTQQVETNSLSRPLHTLLPPPRPPAQGRGCRGPWQGSLPPPAWPPPAELPTVPRIQDGGGGAYLGELGPAAARTGRPHHPHTHTSRITHHTPAPQ